jgi:hypothetical protein
MLIEENYPTIESLKKMGKIIKDPLSVGVSHPLLMMRDGKCIGIGTVFFYSYHEKLFLITAGHNITGTNPQTSEVIAIPEKVGVMICKTKNDCLNGWEAQEIVNSPSKDTFHK